MLVCNATHVYVARNFLSCDHEKLTQTSVPHYHVVSKRVEAGFMSPVVNFLRRWLIEDVYRRLATMFPQTANWLTSADE